MLPGNSFQLTLVVFFHISLHLIAELGDVFLRKTFVLLPVQHQRALERDVIAQGYIGVLIGDFQQSFANGPTLGFAQLGKFLDDFRYAHAEIITSVDNLSGITV